MSVAKVAGARLRPHLRLLVPHLLEALSTLEASSARYVSTAVGQRADAQETVDRLRLSAAKDSPMFRTLCQCIQYIDAEEAAVIVPRLSELMKRNTGLATKCGVALFAARLAAERPLALQQTAGKVLSALVTGMQDRNVTVRRCAAAAAGNVCRAAKPSSVEKLIAKLKSWYMEAEDEALWSVCAVALQSLSLHASSQLKEHAADAASLAFFAMHRTKTPETESELALWEEVWSDLTPGTEGGLRLYLSDIVPLCSAALSGQSWPRKAQAAAALGHAAAALGAGLSGPQLDTVTSVLLAALPGRTWDGKQALLAALADIAENCAAALTAPETLAEAVLRETRREQAEYKAHAVTAAGRVLQHLKLDRFAPLYEVVQQYIEEPPPKEEGSGDDGGDAREDDEEELSTGARLQLQEAAYVALGRAWPDSPQTQAAYWERYVAALVYALPRSTRTHQSAIVASLRPLVARLWLLRAPRPGDHAPLHEAACQLGTLLANALEIPKFPSLRRESLAVTNSMLSAISELRQKQQFPVLPVVGALSVRLAAGLEAAGRDSSHDIQAAAADAKALLAKLAQ